MKSQKIAQRYAKALYDLSAEMNAEERMMQDMELLQHTVSENPGLKHLLTSPLIKPEKKTRVLQAVFDSSFDKMTMAYIAIIIRKKREAWLPGIAEKFVEIYRAEKGIKTVFLKTAVPAGEALTAKIRNIVEEQLSARVELVAEVNPKLLGGFIIDVEGRRFDTSLRSRINALMREYNINIYEKKL